MVYSIGVDRKSQQKTMPTEIANQPASISINGEKQDKGVSNMSEAISTIADQGNEVVSNRIDFLV